MSATRLDGRAPRLATSHLDTDPTVREADDRAGAGRRSRCAATPGGRRRRSVAARPSRSPTSGVRLGTSSSTGRCASCSARSRSTFLRGLLTPGRRCWSPTTWACACAWAPSGAGCRGRPSTTSSSSLGTVCCTTAGSSSRCTTCTGPSRASRAGRRRHAVLNQKMYGAVLAVPLGITTRVTGAEADELSDRVATLSHGRAEVVTLLVEPGPVVPASRHAQEQEETEDRPVIADDTVESRDRERRSRWRRRRGDRRRRPPRRASPRSCPSRTSRPRPTHPAAFRPRRAPVGRTRGVGQGPRHRPLGEPVAPLVIDDFEPEPAYDPVIGPELAAARTRVGLSVDELAERTRIRPHVIESIEVDDFAPVRRRLLRPRPHPHAGPGARHRPGAAAGVLRRPLRHRPDQPAPGVRGRAATGMTGSMRTTASAARTGRC